MDLGRISSTEILSNFKVVSSVNISKIKTWEGYANANEGREGFFYNPPNLI